MLHAVSDDASGHVLLRNDARVPAELDQQTGVDTLAEAVRAFPDVRQASAATMRETWLLMSFVATTGAESKATGTTSSATAQLGSDSKRVLPRVLIAIPRVGRHASLRSTSLALRSATVAAPVTGATADAEGLSLLQVV